MRGVDADLKAKGLSPTFPEGRFCKGCVLPIVDEVTSSFLITRHGASKQAVRAALRCGGFQTLPRYHTLSEDMSGYSGSPWNRDKTLPGKAGDAQHTGANPDFCVRFQGPPALRLVSEVKYLSRRITSQASVEQVRRELLHYLSIESSFHSDWGHDGGFGIMYCGDGPSIRDAELILDH